MHTIHVHQFEGPLELLLELIEKEKLAITDIALSQVTEQYLKAIATVSQNNPDELADFLVVASKLLLIKSRFLLPELSFDEEEADLALQLKMFKEYYDASKHIGKMINEKHFAFSREKPAVPITPVFNPPSGMTGGKLAQLFREVLLNIAPIVELPKEVIRRALSMQDKIANIQSRIAEKARLRFSELLQHSKSKTEVIVTFLALLELVKQRVIYVRQDMLFDEIVVESVIENS